MATTPKLKKADNGWYYVVWSEGRRSQRKSTGTKRLAEANAYLADFIKKDGPAVFSQRKASEPLSESLTFRELWTIYEDEDIKKRPTDTAALQSRGKTIVRHFGDMTAAEITQDEADKYKQMRLDAGYATGTIREELARVVACLRWHASPKRREKALLKPDDVPVIDLPPQSKPRDRWLTQEEMQAIYNAASRGADGRKPKRMSRVERFIWIALQTAARKTVILNLTWDRVDFEVGKIHFQDPDVPVNSRKRNATVSISKTLRPVLKRMWDERTSEYVLDTPHGDVWNEVQRIVAKAGIKMDDKTRAKENYSKGSIATGVSPHTFRHTAATWMARRGVPLYSIAGVLGDTIITVEKIYAKHHPKANQEAVDALYPGDD